MDILQRSKQSIFGLETQLTEIETNVSLNASEISNEQTRALQVETELDSAISILNSDELTEGSVSNLINANNPILNLTDIIINDIVNSKFAGINIPVGEVLYIRGNNDLSEVYNGYNNFIIVYDGSNTSVYQNSTVNILHITQVLGTYPKGYELIDLVNNTISIKISNLLTDSYTDSIQVFSTQGLMSVLDKVTNSFEALNYDNELVVMYDGSSFSAYKQPKVSISDLQSRMIFS